jgi:hypothetical protein
MHDPALLDHHGHNGVAVDLPPLFVYFHNLVYPDVAHEVAGNENEIIGDDTMGVDIAKSVPWCEGLLGGDNRDNLET